MFEVGERQIGGRGTYQDHQIAGGKLGGVAGNDGTEAPPYPVAGDGGAHRAPDGIGDTAITLTRATLDGEPPQADGPRPG